MLIYFLALNIILHLFHFLLLMKSSLWVTLGCLAWKAGPVCEQLHQKPQQKTHQGWTHLSDGLLSHSLQHQTSSNIRFGTAYFRVKSNGNTNLLFQFFISNLFCIITSSRALLLLSLLDPSRQAKWQKVASSLLIAKCLNWKHARDPVPGNKPSLSEAAVTARSIGLTAHTLITSA